MSNHKFWRCSIGLLIVVLLCAMCTSDFEPSEERVILVMGYGEPSAGFPGLWRYLGLETPNIVLYESGLVITHCYGENPWEAMFCQSRTSLDRVDQLVTDIARAEKIDPSCSDRNLGRYGTGPTTLAVIRLRHRNFCGSVRWFLRQPDPVSFHILAGFTADIAEMQQPYYPQRVSVVVTALAPEEYPSNPENIPLWPYGFSPERALHECKFIEHPLRAEQAVFKGIFRTDSGEFFHVMLRPYLPGEQERASCHSWSMWPTYESLLSLQSSQQD